MPTSLPRECVRLLRSQGGVISAGQAIAAGMPDKRVRDQVRAGRWQRLHRGVYATFTGKLDREAELWAANSDAPYVIIHSDPLTDVEMKVITFQERRAAAAFSRGWAEACVGLGRKS